MIIGHIYCLCRQACGVTHSVIATVTCLCRIHIYSVTRHCLPSKSAPKYVDSSHKTSLDFWDCFGREKAFLY